MKKRTKLFLIAIIEAIVVVICYSPGILALSVTSDSKVKAVLSVVVAVVLLMIFAFAVVFYLKKPIKEVVDAKQINNINDLVTFLNKYKDMKYFGKTARTVIEQIKRVEASSNRAKDAISCKFERNSLTWQKYYDAIDLAEKSAIENVASVSNRISFFDESEYERLLDYRNDNIPDDIQEKQLALYKENQCKIDKAIAVNEELILKLETFSMEISNLSDATEQDMDSTFAEISHLTEQLKFYAKN